jgi:hypothetical protein
MLWSYKKNPFPARRLEQIHTLPPVPYPRTIRDVAGPHQPDDRLPATRASRMAQRRCRGMCLPVSVPVCLRSY